MPRFFRIHYRDGEGYQINYDDHPAELFDLDGEPLGNIGDYECINGDASAPPWFESPPPPEPDPDPTSQPRHITQYALRQRFTQAEKAAVEYAAVDKPEDAPEMRQFAAALRAQLRDLDLAVFINLDDPALLNGLRGLEQMGLIAAGRADEVVSAEITDEERYNGA